MNIIICGAGQVGSYAAEELSGAGNNITVIDRNAERIRRIEDTLDVRTLCASCASAETLSEAGCQHADLVVAVTDNDEINMFSAAIAKGVGARCCVARVHHSTYFENRGLNYQTHFGIDGLICPEFSAALAIARTLGNPTALAIESFARGQIEMHEFPVSDDAAAIGISLAELDLPAGTRLATITRKGRMFIPEGSSVIEPGDIIVLVGNTSAFERARKFFHGEKPRRLKVVIMGGPPMAVWLCRALHQRDYSVRLFEINRGRAEELAEKLDWVTVIQADPTDRLVFEEEKLGQVDAFVGLLDDDEHNILGCAWAKSMGVNLAVAAVQRADYLHLMKSVGIDKPFSPKQVAVSEIRGFLERDALRRMSTLAQGNIDVYWLRVGRKARVAGKALRDVKLSPDGVVAVIQHDSRVVVPGASDTIQVNDSLVVIGRAGMDAKLKKLFDAG